MCIVFLAVGKVPGIPLILASNRDEFYDRPTQPMHWWHDRPDILAGRDLKAGGAWLGLRRDGRLVVLTNYREQPSNQTQPSRGGLVASFLTGTESIDSFGSRLEREGCQYEGFNMLFGQLNELSYFSNRDPQVRQLDRGYHGLCNHLLDTPWPKVAKGLETMYSLQSQQWREDVLFNLLADRSRPADEALPQTGIGLEWERMLSPIFVRGPKYGTRSATVIFVYDDMRVRVTERTFRGDPNEYESVSYQFEVSG